MRDQDREIKALQAQLLQMNNKIKYLLAQPAVGCIPGKVQQKGQQDPNNPGSLTNTASQWYQVDLYANGFVDVNGNSLSPSSTVDVWDMQIAADDSIAVDTCTFVTMAGNVYFMQVPAPAAVPGKVVDSGDQQWYQVALYAGGFVDANGNSLNPTSTVWVWQMQISSQDTIPNGTCVFVSKAGTNFFMQVPVWI